LAPVTVLPSTSVRRPPSRVSGVYSVRNIGAENRLR
jgi:hypothetical protein